MLFAEGSFLQIAVVLLVIAVAALLARSDRRSLVGVAALYLFSVALHFSSPRATR
jgi:hypothetical protein